MLELSVLIKTLFLKMQIANWNFVFYKDCRYYKEAVY